MKITYELLMRLVAQITNSNYSDLVFTGSRRFEFGTNLFIHAEVVLNNNQDIDIVFPAVDPSKQLQSIYSSSENSDIITKEFEHTKIPAYIGSSISGYIEILGFRVNLIGRPPADVKNWKFATRIISDHLWEHCPKLKYNRDYRIELFKELRLDN